MTFPASLSVSSTAMSIKASLVLSTSPRGRWLPALGPFG
jgi:hypothetical protein